MVTGVNIAIDVGQALFSDCPLRGSIMRMSRLLLKSVTVPVLLCHLLSLA